MGLPTGKGSLFQIKLDTSTTFYCSRKLIGKVKLSLAEIEIAKPKHNGPVTYEHKAVKELQKDTTINLKRADNGSTRVILNKRDKIQEA